MISLVFSIFVISLTSHLSYGLGPVSAPHSEVELVSETLWIEPEENFYIALRFQLEKDWHIYWVNPGDSGSAPTVRWNVPSHIQPSAIEWPYPNRIPVAHLMNYGYKDQVFLPVLFKQTQRLIEGKNLSIYAQVDYLICKIDCIPASVKLELELPVKNKKPPPHPTWITSIRNSLAQVPLTKHNWKATAELQSKNLNLKINGDSHYIQEIESAEFFPLNPGIIKNASPQTLTKKYDSLKLDLVTDDNIPKPLNSISGVLVLKPFIEKKLEPLVLEFVVPIQNQMILWQSLVFAFIGGLILNLMPCVFPLISIKILSFLHLSDGNKQTLKQHGILFSLGILISFWILTALLLLLRKAGYELGWGFQLQSPHFVATIAALFWILTLNLLDWFEIEIPFLKTTSQHPFLSGMLATIVATPCTAPFMGAAIGFALTQNNLICFLIFSLLGIGMALPYLLFSFFPNLLKGLPKPGNWMVWFKKILAIPLFLSVLWLIWVYFLQVGKYETFRIILALFGILFILKIKTHTLIKLTLIIAALFLSLPKSFTKTDFQKPIITEKSIWTPFSRELLKSLRKEGKAIFIDFTAAWCITCQVNKKLVLSHPQIEKAFLDKKVILLRADWTSKNEEITQILSEFGRSGVPFYILYPRGSHSVPITFSEILTHQSILEELEKIQD